MPTPDPSPPPSPGAAPAPGAGDAAPFDLDALLERCMSNEAVVALVLDKFSSQAIHDLAEVARGVRTGCAQDLARTAHGLKGAAGLMSARQLAELAARLESLGRDGDLAHAENVLHAFEREIGRCLAYLPEARRRLAARPRAGPAEKETERAHPDR